MAIIVDKEEKRRNIALSCRELLLENGIKDLTVSQIAKTAGIGKGTIYEYFSNKEDIVLEIIASFIVEHKKRLIEISHQDISTKEKIYHFYFLLFENSQYKAQLRVYREYLAISLTNSTQQMIEFSRECNREITTISHRIISDAISRGELRSEAIKMIQPLAIYHAGLVVEEHKSALNAKEEMEDFLDTLFILMEPTK
jgi:AcrR family transcriptional regulator